MAILIYFLIPAVFLTLNAYFKWITKKLLIEYNMLPSVYFQSSFNVSETLDLGFTVLVFVFFWPVTVFVVLAFGFLYLLGKLGTLLLKD